MTSFKTIVLALCAVVLAGIVSTGVVRAQQPSARQAVEAAANALGGLDRVRAVRNITLVGFGQYAYQMGGGNISADPAAPQKYNAANDLRRIYDLEHQRFRAFERRNYLFPFAGADGHDFLPVNQNLDGDIGYDLAANGNPTRVARYFGGAQHEDGVHMRRMWMLNNPVALVRAAMDPATKLSAARTENGETVIDLTLKEGDKLSAGFNPRTRRPAFVRWATPRDNLGQVTYTTRFTGYADFSGLMLPLGYDTRLDWRNIDYFKLWVDNYAIDQAIPDLAAPEAVRNTPEPQPRVQTPVAFPVAKGIWRLNTAGTTVIEFKDHITLFELGTNVRQAKANIDFAKTLAPGKPVTQVIASHNHADHVAGLRAAMAEGMTILSRRDNEIVLREMHDHPAPDFPDALARSPKPFRFMPVDERLTLSDGQRTVELYWTRNNIHMADGLFAYVPAEHLMIEGDIGTAAYDYQWWPDNFQDVIDHYHLNVERVSPVHAIHPTNKNVLSYAEVIDLIKGGVQRARARCAAELASNHYFPGCPVQSKRY